MYRDTLLIIDDSPIDLAILNEVFKPLFQVACFEEARPAIAYIRRNTQQICAVLVDICLGRQGAGFSVLQQLQAAPKTMDLPVILITADPCEEYVLTAVEKGAVDFLAKPVNPQIAQERVCQTVRDAWPVGTTILDAPTAAEPLRQSSASDPSRQWESLAELFFQEKPALSFPHYRRLGAITAILAAAYARLYPGGGIAPADAEIIGRAATLCDVGLLGLPDSVAAQGPTGPSGELYYRHTILGQALFASGAAGTGPFADYAAEIACWHHKNYDGSGFPADQSGSIPPSAQLTSTALHLLKYMEDFQDYPDAFRRSLQLLASDVGRSISQEMFFCAQDAQDLLCQELQASR